MNKIKLQQKLRRWYLNTHRPLPWRDTKDPYRIWLSEIILQQTRVEQGLPYYERFTARFPSVELLAQAPEDEVLKLWEGLGYYSRARNLHKAAKQVAELGGVFPQTFKGLLDLPGVGPYTAAAIASFAYEEPVAVVDGNVFRVLARLYAESQPIDSNEGKKLFQELAQDLLDKKAPALHNQAIMELGALTCLPKQPNCSACPWREDCLALAQGSQADLPVKAKKTKKTDRYLHYFLLIKEGRVAVQRREAGIWQGLYQFPLWESDRSLTLDEVAAQSPIQDFQEGPATWHFLERLKPHLLSHQRLHINIYGLTIADGLEWSGPPLQWCSPEHLKTLAFPRPLRGFLDQKQLTLPLI